MLFSNMTIQEIKYSLNYSENLIKMNEYRKVSSLPSKELERLFIKKKPLKIEFW